MSKGRLEAFSDGVIAPLVPVFLTYVMSFVMVGIYWNNHHHMLQAADRINGRIPWANQHLLFWLSLMPFATGWMGQNHFAPLPTAAYGVVLFMAAIGLAFVNQWVSDAIYVVVVLMWLIPDRRIESAMHRADPA